MRRSSCTGDRAPRRGGARPVPGRSPRRTLHAQPGPRPTTPGPLRRETRSAYSDRDSDRRRAGAAGTGLNLVTKVHLLELKVRGAPQPEIDQVLVNYLVDHPGLGSVSILRPDGHPLRPPVEGIWGAWA